MLRPQTWKVYLGARRRLRERLAVGEVPELDVMGVLVGAGITAGGGARLVLGGERGTGGVARAETAALMVDSEKGKATATTEKA